MNSFVPLSDAEREEEFAREAEASDWAGLQGPDPEQTVVPKISATPFCWREPALIPRREWIYGHHLIRRYVSMTLAGTGVGKTSILVNDSLALTTGRDLLGIPVYGAPKRVWYWNLEDPVDEIERRVAAAMQRYAISPADVADRLHVDSGRNQQLCIARQIGSGTQILEPVVDAMVEALQVRQIDVLILDPFVSSHAVSENDNTGMDLVAKTWGRIAERADCAVELAHHLRKMGSDEATAESGRGAVAVISAARSVRVLNRMSKEEAEKAGLEHHRAHFRAINDKENLAPAPADSDWFQLENVTLPNGDNVGVVVPWTWPDPFSDVSSADLLAIQKAVDGKALRLNSQAKAWVGHVVAEVLDIDLGDKASKARVSAMIKTWIENGALVVTKSKAEDRHETSFVEVGKWCSA